MYNGLSVNKEIELNCQSACSVHSLSHDLTYPHSFTGDDTLRDLGQWFKPNVLLVNYLKINLKHLKLGTAVIIINSTVICN